MSNSKRNSKSDNNATGALVNMAYALGRIKNDLENNNEMISNKEEVLGEIRDDLLRFACDYEFVEK